MIATPIVADPANVPRSPLLESGDTSGSASGSRLLKIACARRLFARCNARFFICRGVRRVAMEGAVIPIHFIPSFVVFAFADCWPFRLAKAVTHEVPFSNRNGCACGASPPDRSLAINT